jgi:hypothetical protein
MKRFFPIVILCLIAVPGLQAQTVKLKPGLVGKYFKLKKGLGDKDTPQSGEKLFFVRVDKQVNFAEAGGDFYGSKLVDNFLVRWDGTIRITKAGTYAFHTTSDDGSRLYIDGKKIVENWGSHSMTKKSGSVDLSAGDHAILIVFNEIGGGAGCLSAWTPPGGAEKAIPANVLFHSPEQAKVTYDQKTWKKARKQKKRGGSGVSFDYKKFGSFVGAAVNVGQDHLGTNVAYRGLIIRLNESGDAGIVFDGDTMRMAAGWLEGGLVLGGLPFTGGHGQFPSLTGESVFTNRATPGWAKDGKLDEPREGKYPRLGHLPKDWAHYKGLYLDGDKVVLKYTVGGAVVHEMPSLEVIDEQRTIVRTIQIQHDGKPMSLVVGDVPGDKGKFIGASTIARLTHPSEAVGGMAMIGDDSDADATITLVAANGTQGGKWEIRDQQLLLNLPAQQGKSLFKVVYFRGTAEAVKAKAISLRKSTEPQDLAIHTKGGPARWGKALETKGELGKDDKAYVIDRLTIPNNPFGSQMRIGGMDFFADGKSAAVSTWSGDVWIVSGIDDKLENLKWKRFATGQHEPLGLKIVDGKIYTVADDQITRYHDLNNNGEADFYENFNNDWELTSGFHAFCFDLHTDAQGNFFFAFGSPVRGGGRSFERMSNHHGSIIKVSKDGSKLERYATGLRAPNGMCVSPTGQVTSGDNEGTFVPRCPINWIKPGNFLGVIDSAANRSQFKTTPTIRDLAQGRPKHLDPSEMPKPLAWLPKGVDNSGGGQVWVTTDKWGPFKDELLHMSYGRSSLYLVLKEDKGGQMQGGVVKFPLRFTSSAMRARVNPRDGQIYVAGLKGWQTNASKPGGFDRVRYTGKKVYMPNSLRIKPNGIEIGFTQKLDPELANDADSFAVQAADIRWTHDYGSGEYQIGARETGKYQKGWTKMAVKSAKLLPDGRTVFIEVADMQPVHEMDIRIDLEAADGTEIVSRIWNTVHKTK